MNESFAYADPIHVDRVEDCRFYHRMGLPGVHDVDAQWDLRATVDNYLGHFDFSGKRVLDVGAASGFLTFEMERRGAEVVSFDMASGFQWNLVPHFKLKSELEKSYINADRATQRTKNAYWFAHEKLGSRAKTYYGDIYDLPDELGTFDVVFLGMILSHLRDPFQALYSTTRLSTDTVIITNQARGIKEPVAYFLPHGNKHSTTPEWWSFSEGYIQNMLGVLGFEVKSANRNPHQCVAPGREGPKDCTTFIAHRLKSDG